ncbi:MAG: hypothetical protein R3B09_01105 [Nannocystaceae bacterium]
MHDDFDPNVALMRAFSRVADDEKRLLLGALEGDAGREAYAAHLDAVDPARAEALRLEVRLRDADDPAARARLQALVATLDPDWWWALRSSRVHNCGVGRGEPPRVRFRLICDQSWSAMTPTEAGADVRRCDLCEQSVHRCATIAEANDAARRGECIAVDPKMAHEASVGRGALMLGRPDYLEMWAERIFPPGTS